MRMIIYRLLSIVLIMDLIAIVYFLSVKYMSGAYAAFALVATILLTQIFLIRCKCGCRPGLRVLVIWTLLLDFELYIADSLLRRCPNCKRDLQ